MLRVGFPSILDPQLLSVMPGGIELIPLEDGLDYPVEIDVWIPDPYPTRALRVWPHLRGVRLVLSMMAGTEWIPDAVGPSVTICNARGAHNICTAEWTLTAILAMLKYVPLYIDIQRSGDWRRRSEAGRLYQQLTHDQRTYHPPVKLEELTGKTVLIVGHGSIGKDIERLLGPFHVEILRVARGARTQPLVHPVAELDSLLPRADVIVLILPLTPESKGLIGPRQFALMRQGALLVNAARGGIVQTDALVEALNSGRIRAALDVTDPEPLPLEHPLWRCPNLFLTPHIGGSSPQFDARALQVAADELRRYMQGQPLKNVVQAGT
ncbi:MAG TPA: 2-hydroxyacid dehydrogenase [Terracidiphilus sp.]|jgi:phosphoglycerate dehydrogenase-like enzyme